MREIISCFSSDAAAGSDAAVAIRGCHVRPREGGGGDALAPSCPMAGRERVRIGAVSVNRVAAADGNRGRRRRVMEGAKESVMATWGRKWLVYSRFFFVSVFVVTVF